MTDTTYAAKLAAVSTIADLIALNASQAVDLPAPDDGPIRRNRAPYGQ
ncbi:hypothetical protein [Prescottella equi]|nr:hypothetical protein [Prescottella equi]BCN86208.1 hypothetical protein RE0356_48490 [Prescottella equi]